MTCRNEQPLMASLEIASAAAVGRRVTVDRGTINPSGSRNEGGVGLITERVDSGTGGRDAAIRGAP